MEARLKTRPDVEIGPLQAAVLSKLGWTKVERPDEIGHHLKSVDGKLGLYLLFGEEVFDGKRKHWCSTRIYWLEDPDAFSMCVMLYDNSNDLESFLIATRSYLDVCTALQYQFP